MAVLGKWADGLTDEQIEERRERARNWRRDHPARAESNNVAHRARHRDRQSARNAVRYAMRKGRLVRQPCEVCGEPDTQAHHDDYAEKLDVRWLCVTHHAEADVQRRDRVPAVKKPITVVWPISDDAGTWLVPGDWTRGKATGHVVTATGVRFTGLKARRAWLRWAHLQYVDGWRMENGTLAPCTRHDEDAEPYWIVTPI